MVGNVFALVPGAQQGHARAVRAAVIELYLVLLLLLKS